MAEFPRTLKKLCPQTGLYISLNLTLKSFALDITVYAVHIFFGCPKKKTNRLNTL